MVLDAAGLALFSVAGAGRAVEYKDPSFRRHPSGCITGVGGGTMRDLLLAQVPTVLHADVYASAALAGAAVMIARLKLRLPRVVVMTLGGIVCFVLRVVSARRGW
jgi:uncharacterized membrane protein YeiH